MKVLIFALFLGACSNFSSKLVTAPVIDGHDRHEYEDEGEKWAIASQGEHSSAAGAQMFALGGNAVDAAAAISFAISVERPQSTGIGGGGFLLLHGPGFEKPIAFDFREKAPLRAHRKMYLDKNGEEIKRKSLDGIFAVGVPGLVAGVLEVHRRYGLLDLSQVIAPAIELAENGFDIYPELAKAIDRRKVNYDTPTIINLYTIQVSVSNVDDHQIVVFIENGVELNYVGSDRKWSYDFSSSICAIFSKL